MKSRRFYSLIVLWLCCMCNFAYAKNDTQGVNSDSRLIGPQNVLNMEYRQDFYGEKSRVLENEFAKQSWIITSDKAVAHFEILFDSILGIDFSKEKKGLVLQTQRRILEQKDRLVDLYKSGSISFEEYVEQLSGFIETGFAEISNILTDEEFLGLFQFNKAKTKGSFYELINQGLPENERVFDQRK